MSNASEGDFSETEAEICAKGGAYHAAAVMTGSALRPEKSRPAPTLLHQ